ncbi:MAG: tetratricopeptide repeat protein, partial [bacterium]
MNPQWLQDWGRQGINSEFMSYKNFGDSFLHQGEYNKAIAQYQRALQIKPDQAGVMINLAVAYMYSNSYKDATKILRDASKLESNLKDLIVFNIGELMEKQGKKDIALEYYKKALGSIYIDPV